MDKEYLFLTNEEPNKWFIGKAQKCNDYTVVNYAINYNCILDYIKKVFELP